MDQAKAEMLANDNLESFKERMLIFNDSRDDDIKRMLATSFQRIESLIGDYDENNNLKFIDLVFNRTRYDFNDQVEFFEDNFQHVILDLSLEGASNGD